MKLQLSRTYTLTLALAMVIGPFLWLVVTEDGQRRTDLALLHLFGRPSFNLNPAGLSAAVTEETLAKRFPQVEWQCQDQPSNLGERLCAARIGGFNGVPASTVRAFYTDGGLNALRLDYQRRYHRTLVAVLRGLHGAQLDDPEAAPHSSAADAPPPPSPVLRWALPGGLLLLPEQLDRSIEPALLWLAPGALPRG